MMQFLGIKYLLTHNLIQTKIEFDDIDIGELLDIQHKQLSSRVERWTHEGSGSTINSIIQHQLVIP